jgi:dihydroflavonol-4-reductase
MDETSVYTSNKLPDETANVFVTGASGLVGSHLVSQLVEKGEKVKAVYRNFIPDIAGKEQVEWVRGDILDVVFLDDALKNISEVYHCAGRVSFHPKQRHELFEVNVTGTANVVNASLNNSVRKFCLVSSVAALGKNKKGEEISEEEKWVESAANSVYGKSKYLAELEVWRGIGEGLSAVIVNPSIILGAGDWSTGSTKLFKTAYEEFPWYTEGVTGFVDVKDVVKAMVILMRAEVSAERFVISADNRPFSDVFTAIAKAFNRKPPTKKVTPLMARVVTLFESIKSLLTGGEPLLTKETANAAQSKVYYSNTKLKATIPSFTYTPIDGTITRVCKELKHRYNL